MSDIVNYILLGAEYFWALFWDTSKLLENILILSELAFMSCNYEDEKTLMKFYLGPNTEVIVFWVLSAVPQVVKFTTTWNTDYP